VDPFGRVWVSCDDDSIRVYEPTGGVLLFAFGGSGSGDGEFQTPYGIAFDPSGDAYICDYVGARVEKFASDGSFLLSWPIPSTHADHVSVDDAGDVYVTGFTDFSVHKYDATGTPITDWTMNGGSQNSGVLAAGGTVRVVGWNASIVEEFASDGTFLGSFDDSTLGGADIEMDSLGQIWIADYYNDMVRIFAADGTPVEAFGTTGTGPGEFDDPIGITVAPDGSIYVCDQTGGRVQHFGSPLTTVSPGDAALSLAPTFRSVAPNPCRESVALMYSVPRTGRLSLAIFDVSGRRIATLEDGVAAAGTHRFEWSARHDDGRPVAAGVYFARLASERGASAVRLVVVR
jgi:sugar lactone lactonase YvrE